MSIFDQFHPIDAGITRRNPIRFPEYSDQAESDNNESVTFGQAKLDGRDVIAAIFDFKFMGGSMGEVAGGRLEAAMELAGEKRWPFIAVTASGGARMQEGMAALGQMPRTVAAASKLSRLGVPSISVLLNPTTGGVYASFASLADFILAEAGATIGFAGPRVAEAFTGSPLSSGSHTAEAAWESGLLDGVYEPSELRKAISTLVSLLTERRQEVDLPKAPQGLLVQPDAWSAYTSVREASRPAPFQYIKHMSSETFEINGDRAGANDKSVRCGLARVVGQTVAFATLNRGNPAASGFRKAQRIIRLAGKLSLPLVTLIDTQGADPSGHSEYSGLAGEIARTFEAILTTPSPVISIVTGEGGSGGALALACGDIIGIQTNAVFSVIAPEGAAAILFRDKERAPEAAKLLRPTAADLFSSGVADEVIPEPAGGAQVSPDDSMRIVENWIGSKLDSTKADPEKRTTRFRDFRSLTD